MPPADRRPLSLSRLDPAAELGLSQLYVIGVGSNLGDREALIEAAATQLSAAGVRLLARSPIRETAPIGGVADQPFLNAAWLCAGRAEPEALLVQLHAIEAALGRTREQRWSNRTLDLDLLLWRSLADAEGAPSRRHQTPPLLPHPRLLERAFALQPAAEVAPNWIHPDTGRRLAEEAARMERRGCDLPDGL